MNSRWKISPIVLVLAALFPLPGQALIYTYDNTTSGAIGIAATPCSNPLDRNFTVSDSFTVSSIGLGLNLTHTYRGDMQGTLVAPGGTSFQFLASNGGDGDDNYDVLFSTNTEGAVDDGSIDPVAAPFYNRPVSVPGMNFYTGTSAGTWSLQLCDVFAGDDGTFNRAHLVLTSAPAAAPVCTGTVTYDWGSNGNSAAFVSTTLGDIVISQGATTDFAGTASTNAFQTRTTTQGNHTGYYALTMDASAIAGTQTSESVGLISSFTFSRPIQDLSFSFLDVDIIGGAWEDLISPQGLDSSGTTTPFSLTFPGTVQIAADRGEGDSTVAPTSNAGNADVVFEGPTQTLTINYNQADNPTSENVFMIVGISDLTFCAYDYGDAPNTYGTALGGGARHVLGDRSLYLGVNPPDGEADGQPGAPSTTDDTTTVGGVDDEDGVAVFPPYVGGSATYTVPVVANNLSPTLAATLVGYIDWNRDGDFNDAGERSASVAVPANTTAGTFNVTWSGFPANAGGTSSTYARFRISYTAAEVISPTGLATSGEVEDYQIPINTLPVTLAAFQTQETGSGWDVRWTTETETSTVGYQLLGLTPSGEVQLTKTLVPSHFTDSLTPQTYELELNWNQISRAEVRALFLISFDTRGKETRHGPFLLSEEYGEEPQRQLIDWSAIAQEIAFESRFASNLSSGAEDGGDSGDRKKDRDDKKRGDGDWKEGQYPVAELLVDREGLYRLTYEDLLAAGLDFAGAPLRRLGLTLARTGTPVPLHVEADSRSESFGAGAFIEFKGEPLIDSLHSRERVYRLEVLPRSALRPQRIASAPRGPLQTHYLETVSVNRDKVYSFASPNGDPWYEERVLAYGREGSRDFLIDVEGSIHSEGTLEVELWGVTDWPGEEPDHHVLVELNGQTLAEERFDGLTPKSYHLPLPSGLLLEGENRLTVRLPGVPAYAFDLVHVDRYSITYPRHFTAQDGVLALDDTAGRVEIFGIAEPNVVAWSGNGTQRLSGIRVAPVKNGYRAEMQIPSSKSDPAAQAGTSQTPRTHISTISALLEPSIRSPRPVASDLLTGPASYLIITHPAFAAGLAPLTSAKESQGLSVKVVNVFDLYSRYTGGEIDPEAIDAYIEDAASQLDTRFVLLVGGDTYDPFDNLGVGSMSFIPTPYVQTDDQIRFTPADPLLGDLDDDGVPDLPVGRLPVRSTAELDQMVAKTLAFSGTPASVLFAADEDSEEAFTGLSEELATRVPKGWPVTTAYLDEQGRDNARATLITAFNSGPALVSFVGHSGPTVWSFQSLFANQDADALTNTQNPSLVMQLGCWNSYHVAPAYDTLAHRLLLAGPQGAAALLGSATVSKSSSDFLIGPAFTTRIFLPGKTVGEAMIEAKREVAKNGGDLRDILAGWNLLGDPALVLVP